MLMDFTTDDESTLVEVKAWCREATSHTWANIGLDLCCLRASIDHNELKEILRYSYVSSKINSACHELNMLRQVFHHNKEVLIQMK